MLSDKDIVVEARELLSHLSQWPNSIPDIKHALFADAVERERDSPFFGCSTRVADLYGRAPDLLRVLADEVDQLQSQLEQLRAERDALRDSASIVAFQAHQIDGKIAESLIAQGETALRSRVLELCKSKVAACQREAERADMRLRSSERDVIENEARAIKELATELEKL